MAVKTLEKGIDGENAAYVRMKCKDRTPHATAGDARLPGHRVVRRRSPSPGRQAALEMISPGVWLALYTAPGEGAGIAGLMRASGMTRPTLYRHLA